MSRELIENLREYADIAEAGEKSHWAKAMREAAEYIVADLEKPLPEPVSWTNKHELGDQEYCSNSRRMWVTPGCGGNMPLYAEPQARSPLSDDEIRDLWRSNGGEFHGPNIETGTMPENQLLPFIRELMALPARKPLTEEEFLNLKLPCDIKIGSGKNRAGTTIETLLLRANNIYEGAMLIKRKSLSDDFLSQVLNEGDGTYRP